MTYLEPETFYRVKARTKKESKVLRRIFQLVVQDLENSIYPDIEMYYKVTTTTRRKIKPRPTDLPAAVRQQTASYQDI